MATLPHMALALFNFIHWMTEYKVESNLLSSATMEEADHDHHHHNQSEPSSDQKVEALDLLEESWFFENLFNRRSRMLRCYSDPCSSPSFAQDVLAKDSSPPPQASTTSPPPHCGLIRAPSLPPCIGRQPEEKAQERKSRVGRIGKLDRQLSLQPSIKTTTCTVKTPEVQEKKTSDHPRKGKLIEEQSSSRCNLLRTPSLPTSLEEHELIQDNENDIRMSRLIRQALAISPVPPRHNNSPKAMTPKCRQTMNNPNGVQESRRRYPNQMKTLQKSYSDVAFEEVQGFKDLGFRIDNEEHLMRAGLQENKTEELRQDKGMMRRPYSSEAWLAQGRGPPIPNCVSKDSAKHMKAQLKFWARAVATNVRQEC